MEVVHRELGQPFFRDLCDELALAGAQDERRALRGVGILRIAPAELERELDLALVDVFDGERAQLSVLDDVHAGPVGDSWDGHLCESGQGRAVVERAAESRSRLDEEPLRLLRALAVLDVRVRAEPLDDLPPAVAHRDRARQVPAVGVVRRPAEAELVVVGSPGVERLLPELDRARAGSRSRAHRSASPSRSGRAALPPGSGSAPRSRGGAPRVPAPSTARPAAGAVPSSRTTR